MRKESLYLLLAENGVYDTKSVSEDEICENDIIIEDDNFGGKYKIIIDDTTKDDMILTLLAKQTSYLKSIKAMVKFFVILTVIGMAIMLFWCFGATF